MGRHLAAFCDSHGNKLKCTKRASARSTSERRPALSSSGQDVLEVDPSQLDLNALPDSEFDALEPLTQPDTELLQLASTGPLSKYILSPLWRKLGTGRLLSPGDNTLTTRNRG